MKNLKNKINNVIERTLPLLLIFGFALSGWFMFFYYIVDEDVKQTEALNLETDSIRNSLPNVSSITSTSKTQYDNIEDELWKYIEELKTENRELRDSVIYYSIFYDCIKDKFNCEYKFSVRDSANTRMYSGMVIIPPKKQNSEAIASDSVEVNDSVSTDSL